MVDLVNYFPQNYVVIQKDDTCKLAKFLELENKDLFQLRMITY